jgi:hypothetical protein
MKNIFQDAEIISTYTRAQAIDDGVLIDLSGNDFMPFKYPVAVTVGLWNEMASGLKWERDHDKHDPKARNLVGMDERINDLLNMAVMASKAMKKPSDRAFFTVTFGKTPVKCWSLCGPSDTVDPVLTIMLEGED